MKSFLAALVALTCSACHVGYGFRGPGVSDGRLCDGLPTTVIVAVTAGDIEPGETGAMFSELESVMDSLEERDGLIGFMVRKQTFGRRVWTMSVWKDDESLERFLASAEHRRAVRHGGLTRASVRNARARLPAARLPLSWGEATSLLEAPDS